MKYSVMGRSVPGPLNLICGAGNFGKIWPACRQHEIQHIEWRTNKYTYNYMHNLTRVFSYIIVCNENRIELGYNVMTGTEYYVLL
jgi:hypothetical protein